MRERILNQPIDSFNIHETTHLAKMAFVNANQLKIITLNPEMIVNANHNFEFQAALNNANLIVPDGIGIILAAKWLDSNRFNGIERVPGIELAEKVLELANEMSKKLAIFGGKKNTLEKVVSIFTNKYPNIQIVKAIDGYQNINHTDIAMDIASGKPDLVLVALGTPKQEIWINKQASLFPKSILIGVGGSLDVWSGEKQRAPLWIRNCYLEWLFRTITDPQRIPRILKTLPEYTFMVLKTKWLQFYSK